MAKRKRTSSNDRKLKDERGQGTGIDYKPWITIQDVPSLGRATRLKGHKVPRQYEFLSDLERNYFYLLEFADAVIDIREQYPLLPTAETVLIAEELGLNHPVHPQTREPIEMTTDFLVTIMDNEHPRHLARTLKYKDELSKERVLEKFEIERVFWERQGVDWRIVTENEVPKGMAQNIASIHGYTDLSFIEGFEQATAIDLEDMSVYFIKRLLDEEYSIRQIAKSLERDFGMNVGSGLSVFKHLLITKVIEMDLSSKVDVNNIIRVTNIRKDYSEKVKVG